MTLPTLRFALLWLLPAVAVCTLGVNASTARQDSSAKGLPGSEQGKALQVQYLEIVTPNVDDMCNSLETMHGVKFGLPEANLGDARTAALEGGGRIGVRAPMRESEAPVVRPYMRTDNIEAAIKAAETAGAEIAMPPTEIPARGKFAIYIQGGIQHGLWEI